MRLEERHFLKTSRARWLDRNINPEMNSQGFPLKIVHLLHLPSRLTIYIFKSNL